MPSSHMLRALGEMSKHGGNYFGQMHIEGNRQKRIQDAKIESERIYQRNRGDKQTDVEDARVYAGEQHDIQRTDKAEDAETAKTNSREQSDYQANLNKERDALNRANKNEDKAKESDIETFYDKYGNPKSYKVNGNGDLTPVEELDGLSTTNPNKEYKETEGQRKNRGFLHRMSDSSHRMHTMVTEDKLDMGDTLHQLTQYSDINAVKDPVLRNYAINMADWYRSKLRKESGAVIGDKEAMDEIKTYFPYLGDTETNLAEKRRKRAIAEESLYIEVHGRDATRDGYVSKYGDPWGLFSGDKKKTNGRNSSSHPTDIQDILDAQKGG